MDFLLLLLHTLYLLRITGQGLTLLSKDDHLDYPPLCHISTQLASTWIHYQHERLLNIKSTQVFKNYLNYFSTYYTIPMEKNIPRESPKAS